MPELGDGPWPGVSCSVGGVGDVALESPPPWVELTARAREEYLDFRTPTPEGDEVDLVAVYATLAARLPKDTLVTCGAGNYAIWPQRFLIYRDFPHSSPRRNGSMGYSVPSGVAAASGKTLDR
ncbi:MAG TPA: hypothetical protein VE198_02850 [Actinoallomurus sp.]|nr:hypothetical protein [Actinoallomurus sp.]